MIATAAASALIPGSLKIGVKQGDVDAIVANSTRATVEPDVVLLIAASAVDVPLPVAGRDKIDRDATTAYLEGQLRR